ncbi:hypothetical protein NQ317_003929 [Molorchus minor]|uniref:DNA repair protein SWI5 homolog n=1 Tax=Molorchus minor TaxID=1323400 RepID=A0ABQ9IVL8_9CUCU|nr:hypothetical protein NQ317_003929 [Molorchus minor]
MEHFKSSSSKKIKQKKIKRADSKESCTLSELKARQEKLLKEDLQLNKEIEDLQTRGISTDLQPQMQALHEYNEMKDLTQMVLGYLADAEHVTVSELHKRYDLPME